MCKKFALLLSFVALPEVLMYGERETKVQRSETAVICFSTSIAEKVEDSNLLYLLHAS
jgi:hypothetical protein